MWDFAGESQDGLITRNPITNHKIPITNFLMPFHFENKPSLIAYVTAATPISRRTREVILAAIDAGASVIELGVPFSDPLAMGQSSSGPANERLNMARRYNMCSHSPPRFASIRNQRGRDFFLSQSDSAHGRRKFCRVSRHAGVDGVSSLTCRSKKQMLSTRGAQEWTWPRSIFSGVDWWAQPENRGQVILARLA